LDGPLEQSPARGRLEGYLKALKELNIPKNDDLIKVGSWKSESGKAFIEELFRGPIKPDAVFIANMELTLGSMVAIKEMNLKIPEDLAVLSFSGTGYYWAAITDPPLTTIDFPIDEIGKKAIEILLKKIMTKKRKKNQKYKKFTIKTHLTVRGSTLKKNKLKGAV